MPDRPQKITFADMRATGVRGLLVYRLQVQPPGHAERDRWPGEMRLSDLEPRFMCSARGKRGADVRPDFNWNKMPAKMMDYR